MRWSLFRGEEMNAHKFKAGEGVVFCEKCGMIIINGAGRSRKDRDRQKKILMKEFPPCIYGIYGHTSKSSLKIPSNGHFLAGIASLKEALTLFPEDPDRLASIIIQKLNASLCDLECVE